MIPVVVEKKFDEHVYVQETCTFSMLVDGGPNTEANWFVFESVSFSINHLSFYFQVKLSVFNCFCI